MQGFGATAALALAGCTDVLDGETNGDDDSDGTDSGDDGTDDDRNGEGEDEIAETAFEMRLYEVAADTWSFVEAHADETTGFVPDRLDADGNPSESRAVTSPANIGLQLLSVVAATELEIIEEDEGEAHAARVFDTLEDVERWEGQFYRWYDVSDGEVDEEAGGWWEISTVDNGWLTAGVATVGGAFPSLRDRADDLLESQDYEALFDDDVTEPFDGETVGQFYGGFDARDGDDLGFHYDLVNSEARIASYVAIGKGDVPRSHWWHLLRTLPPDAEQNQEPEGEFVTYEGEEVWQGTYEHGGNRFVPSWGGSMFESLMPSLVVPEPELATEGFDQNNARHVQLQIDHADEQGYEAWGFSPCAEPGGYDEFAVEHAGMGGYERDDIVTPHATFLGLGYADESDVESALDAYEDRGLYTEYGFFDSMSVVDDEITEEYLILDQSMSLVAIANFLTDGGVREAFRAHPIGEEPEELLELESFGI
ncbi:DUF3131 domain-containing protein [Halobacteria archaeon AArc-dxtr1]|nr:DUF3131 domain-containing protein [Halobacteria archaeon AArc-dxtr1]